VGAVLFIGGVAVLLFGILQLQKARENLDWPNVKGQVLSSDIETRRYRSIDSTISVNKYLPYVEYIYSVNGIKYRSDKFSIRAHGERNTLEAAENDLAAFPPGDDITVYYDPEEPRSAVLRPGASLGVNFIIQSLGLLVIGTCTMFGARFSD